MLRHRLTLGPVLILTFLGVIWLDQILARKGWWPGLVLTAFLLVVGTFAGRELSRIFKARQITTSRRIVVMAVWAGLLSSSFTAAELNGLSGSAVVCTTAMVVLVLSMTYYSRDRSPEGVVAASAATLLAFVYVGLMGGFAIVVHKEFGGWVLVGVVLVAKAYDIGAYFTGRLIGKHKLIPWLSPGKTWEGVAGGVVLASAVAIIAASWLAPMLGLRMAWWQAALTGAFLGAVAQAGDLLASLLKRDAGIKDYSGALPGFGGVMDVADSPLLVAPAAYWFLKAFAAPATGS